MIRTVLLCFTAMLGVALDVSTSTAAPADEAEQVTERLFTAVGGRLVWAGLASTIVYTQLYGQTDAGTVDAIIMTDYPQRRFRIDAIGANMHLVRVVDGEKDRSWRLDRAQQEAGTADRMDPGPYLAQAFRILQRVAAADPALKLTIVRKGGLDELDVYEGAARLAWYRLDARNEPYLMGVHDDNVGVICGPWDVERDRIRYPGWLTRPDGSWRVTVKSLAVNIRTDERLFSQPVVASQSP